MIKHPPIGAARNPRLRLELFVHLVGRAKHSFTGYKKTPVCSAAITIEEISGQPTPKPGMVGA